MKSLLLVVLSLGLAAWAFAEDAPKKEKSDSSPSRRTYEPLIIPGGEGGGVTPVPQPGKDVPADGEKEDAASSGPESSSAGRVPLPVEDEKKKRSLWIYTLPDEQAARKKQQEQEERQLEQLQEIRKAGQLPEWAVDPEFRKYFLEQDPQAVPNAGTQGSGFFDMGLDWKTPKTSEEESAESEFQGTFLLKEPDRKTGTVLSTGKDPVSSGAAKDAPSRPPGDATDYDRLYQSNQKQKRMEDFHDGLNKPVEVEQSSDRYHKPQKPQ